MNRTPHEIEEIIEIARLHLYNQGVPCGPGAIRAHMDEMEGVPVPSEYLIKKTLRIRGLTHGRTGIYPGEEMEG